MHKTKSEDIIGLLPVLGLQEGDALAGCQASFGIHPFSYHPARSPHLSSSIEGCDLRLASESAPSSLARYLLMFSIGEGRNWKRKGPLLHDGRSVLLFVYLTFTESPQKAKVDGEKQWDLCRRRDSPLISVNSSNVRGK